MPRNGSGTYTLPAGNPVVTGTVISSTWANNTLSDIGTALTQSVAKDGQTTPTANLPLGGFKLTNVAAATTLTDYLRADQGQNSSLQWLTSVSGTDTITGSPAIAPSAYADGQTFRFIAVGANTGAVTINVSSLGAKSIKKRQSGGKVALAAADIVSGLEYSITYDGTDFVLNESRPYSHGTDIASASTINLDTATGDCVDVTGTVAITAITLAEGEERTVRFTGVLTLTNSASLVNLTGANIATAVGDYAVFRGYSSGVVRMVSYARATGAALLASNQIQSIGTPSVSSNALTLPGASLTLDFRSTTLGSGAITTVSGTPADLVVPAGATLGTVNAVASRLIRIVLNNAGTLEQAIVNLSGGVSLDETGLISTTAISAGATSANVVYSTTARTNLAYRVIGAIDSTQATAGQWATSPSLAQGVGGQALVTMSSIGYGQTWQNVTGSRTWATTYYNTTGRPIQLEITVVGDGATTATLNINGAAHATLVLSNTVTSALYPIISPGESYSITRTGGYSIQAWWEKR